MPSLLPHDLCHEWNASPAPGKREVAQSCLTLRDPMDFTAHGILQARILEWVAFSFSRESSQPRDLIQSRSPTLQADSGFLGGRCSRISRGTPEARSRLCVCRASFLMTFVTSGMSLSGSRQGWQLTSTETTAGHLWNVQNNKSVLCMLIR